jgi:hypothetical protein
MATLGIALMVLSVFIGLYVGVWVMFIGGIVQVINTLQIHPVQAMGIAVGIFRIMGAAVVGFISFLFLFMSGLGLYKTKRTLRLGRRPKQF